MKPGAPPGAYGRASADAPRPVWRGEASPETLFRDGELAALARGVTGALSSGLPGGGALLAVPISEREPFPMMPIFCFGTPAAIGGAEYLVFTIRDGKVDSPL
ncbi:MAG: hypothetical protein LBD92_00290 [Oscillospiraceae bacterium]|jgi:hypothetical protein|nr:hypothetical protein [Oscillospiraceae bacterium]